VCGRTRPLRVVTSEARVRVLVLNSEGQLEPAGDVVQPSEVLHKHPVLVERGSFRATKLTLDRLEHAREQFILEPEARGWLPVVLAEMTLRNLLAAGSGNHSDFLTRVDILRALGTDVLPLPAVLRAGRIPGRLYGPDDWARRRPARRARDRRRKVLHRSAWRRPRVDGLLFKRFVKTSVRPTREPVSGEIRTIERASARPPWYHLRGLLLDVHPLEAIRGFDEAYLSIRTPDVLARIEKGDASWERLVPPAVADIIRGKKRGFGSENRGFNWVQIRWIQVLEFRNYPILSYRPFGCAG